MRKQYWEGNRANKYGIMSKSLLWNLGLCSQTLRKPVCSVPQSYLQRLRKSAYLSTALSPCLVKIAPGAPTDRAGWRPENALKQRNGAESHPHGKNCMVTSGVSWDCGQGPDHGGPVFANLLIHPFFHLIIFTALIALFNFILIG